MNRTTENYLQKAANDAAETVQNFQDEILTQLLAKGKASADLNNDYPGGASWHHECHVDKSYSLRDAANVLDQLDEFEETDSGLWEGLDMKDALSACAAYTYGNAVASEWADLIKQINDEAELIIADFTDEARDLESEIDSLNGQAEDADSKAEDAEDADKPVIADSFRLHAADYRDEAEEKQQELDTIDGRRKTALSEMIERVADRT